ncbi:MAG: Gfo/Idh/MocA family oxidoreductase [Verrucomicrobiales bacterium]|jgi:predicted dehydrogenase|nr:Gfo/Idh/MocA family oxidoreductase [Verrucomicrobiales bacterium]
MSNRTLNIGMIGGGGGAFIAQPHQRAIHMDGTRRITAAALHPDPNIAMSEAANWPYPLKGYESYDALLAAHQNAADVGRLDYVLIVTPNFVHFDPAFKAVELGLPVMCEKPLCMTMDEADQLVAAVQRNKVPFSVAHTYLGHWTTLFSRHIIRGGLLGDIRWVDSSYLQGWLATKLEDADNMQASWRTNPKAAGKSGCGGDIGTHALMQLRFLTGLDVVSVSARLENFVPGRLLDDHFTVYGKLGNGGRAIIRASQICHGHKNDLAIEVVGTKGSLVWRQEESEALTVLLPGQPDRKYWRGAVSANDGFLGDLPAWLMAEPKIPSGHNEAFHDAYARLHRFFEADVRAYWAGQPFQNDGSVYANVHDGRMGMAFIDASVRSSEQDGAWVDVSLK